MAKVIQFILPGAGLSGGVKVVFQYANYLHEKGHTVRIIYPGKVVLSQTGPKWRFEALLRNVKYGLEKVVGKSEGDWFPLKVPLIRKASLEARYIPSADITIATGNETADWVAKLPPRCGKQYYFIQDYEDWLRDEEELQATYTLPLRKIVISSTLKQKIAQYTKDELLLVPNGIDIETFNNKEVTRHDPMRLLMLYHVDARKGVADGIAALQAIMKKGCKVEVHMFGATPLSSEIPGDSTYHLRPSHKELRELYASTDIFLSPSHKEGFGLPALEAMACGCALVATNVGGVPDYTNKGKLAEVVEPGDVEAMTEALYRLLQDPDLITKRKLGQEFVVKHFSFTKAATLFEQVILG